MTFSTKNITDAPPRTRSDLQEGVTTDVAIIGGGVAGCYCAWRLAGEDLDVDLFESSGRLGGRLLSSPVPGTDLIAELGGMRYHTSHEITSSLIENVLALDWHRFLDGIDETRFAYLRRKRVSAAISAVSSEQSCQSAYDIGQSAQRLAPGAVFKMLAARVLLADSEVARRFRWKIHVVEDDAELLLSRADWDAIKQTLRYVRAGSAYDGMLVRDLGFQNVIKDQLSHEYYQYLADACGYYSDTQNWNAAEALHYLIGDKESAEGEYRAITGGYDELVTAMATHGYDDGSRQTFWTENKLVSIRPGKNRRYQLVINNQIAGAQWSVEADRIILAIPRRSIELLDQTSFMFDDRQIGEFVGALRSVQGAPAFKLVMLFDRAWWLDACGFEYGKSVTDLPLRQCLYFGRDRHSGKALLLASYNDMSTVEFWRALIPRDQSVASQMSDRWVKLDRAPATAGATALAPSEFRDPAWYPLIAEAVAELSELHETDVPFPEAVAVMDWSADPYGGGYHAWLPRVGVKESMERVRNPGYGMAIHVVGEAYSDRQGWVEGALCTAERCLQDVMGLEPPDWLNAPYYLGR